MGKFINPFTDMGFKRIFGQEFSKPLLLDFLNNLLKGERHIVDLRFLDKEQPAEYVGDRSLIYDIYCETDNGDKIIVEMQNRDQPYFKNRSIYYISEAIARQGERGSVWNYNIKAVYLVAFLNFTQEEIGSKFRTDVVLADRESKETFSEMLRMVYLQLPYFQKEADACENDFERWIYVLKNMETLNRMPWMAKNSLFERLSQIAEVGALSREERMKYDRSLKALRDTYSVYQGAVNEGLQKGLEEGLQKGLEEGLQKGLEEGRAEGLAEGRAEGRAETNRENARKLKQLGVDLHTIAQATDLSVDEIAAL